MKHIIKVGILFFLMLFQVPKTSSGEYKASIIFKNYDLSNTLFMNRVAVQRIFTRQDRRWSNGDEILVFIKPLNSLEHKKFVTEVLQMSFYRYEKTLMSNIATGKSIPLTEVNSDLKMSMYVNNRQGAIGYINYNLEMCNKQVILICDDFTRCDK